MKTLFESGKLRSKINLVLGKREGVNYRYYENGNVEAESNFINDVQQGTTKWFMKWHIKGVYNYNSGH
jgi:antitoxin component YwqK of YwqJK toxin-antitoxin module